MSRRSILSFSIFRFLFNYRVPFFSTPRGIETKLRLVSTILENFFTFAFVVPRWKSRNTSFWPCFWCGTFVVPTLKLQKGKMRCQNYIYYKSSVYIYIYTCDLLQWFNDSSGDLNNLGMGTSRGWCLWHEALNAPNDHCNTLSITSWVGDGWKTCFSLAPTENGKCVFMFFFWKKWEKTTKFDGKTM